MIGKPIGRFRLLLLVILMIIGLRPFIDGLVAVNIAADFFVAATFISGVFALSAEKKSLYLALSLAISAIIIKFAQYLIQLKWLGVLNDALVFLFLIQMLIMIVLYIRKETEVTIELLMGAVCGYLLLGLIWSYAYEFLEVAHANSFKGDGNLVESKWAFVYYSFVTLTTVGFGDITPITNQARGLSILEAIFGQLYLAILIADLVGLHAAKQRNN